MLQLVEVGLGAHLAAKGQRGQGQNMVGIWGYEPCGHQPQETPRDVPWALPVLLLLPGHSVWRGWGPGGLWRGRNTLLEVQEERAGHGRGQPESILFYHAPSILSEGAPTPWGKQWGCSSGTETRLGGLELLLVKGGGLVPPGKARQGDPEGMANTKHDLCPQCHHCGCAAGMMHGLVVGRWWGGESSRWGKKSCPIDRAMAENSR